MQRTNYTDQNWQTFILLQNIFIENNCFQIILKKMIMVLIKNIKQHNYFQHW